MAQRVLTEFRVVIFYISLIFWPRPSRLNLDHDFPLSVSWFDPPSTMLCAAAILGLVSLAVLVAKKERLMSYCILWFFGNLVIESSVIGLELVFEHRNYLPSMLFILAVVLLVYRWLKSSWLKPAVLLAVAAVLAVWTYDRNKVWIHPITIWKDCTEKSPGKARPFNNLGVALGDLGRYEEALRCYRKALQLDPGYAEAYGNLGYDLALQGHLEEAVQNLEKAIQIDPKYYEAYNNLGLALIAQGQYLPAIRRLRAAIAIKPDNPEAHNNLGVALRRLDRLPQAMRHFSEAIKIDPQFAPAYNNLGITLADMGRPDEAIAYFREALRIDPHFEKARQNLQESLKKRG